jgi:hypothetical protein
MVSARSICVVVASAFAIQLAACSGSDPGSSTIGPAPPGAAPGSSSGRSSSSSGQPGTTQTDAGAPATGGDSGSAPDAAPVETSACAPYIGKWLATLDQGATVTGTDTNLVGGGPVPITGTIDFTLTHDDADYPNILDFTGNAKISGAGITINQALQPETSPTGDPKDTTCDTALHFHGQTNVNGIGVVVFEMVGTLDTTVTPAVGTGPFTMKTADDNGAALSGSGTVHFVRQ